MYLLNIYKQLCLLLVSASFLPDPTCNNKACMDQAIGSHTFEHRCSLSPMTIASLRMTMDRRRRFNKCTNSVMTIGYSSTLVFSLFLFFFLYRLSPYCQHIWLDLAFVRSPLNLKEPVFSPVVSPGVYDQLKERLNLNYLAF